jgi:hypothetical protein
MNFQEFKSSIAVKAQTGKASEAEISVGTIFNIVNSRPAFSGAGFSRLKTASDCHYDSVRGYYLLNVAATTAVRKQWALQLVGQLAVSVGFNPQGLDEQGVKTALDSLMLSGEQAKYAREIMNAVTAVAIVRSPEYTRGQFIDAAYELQLSTATGLQELRFSSLSPVKAEIAKASKASILNIFGNAEDDLEDAYVAPSITSAVSDAL